MMDFMNSTDIIHIEIKLKSGNTRVETIGDVLKSELTTYFEHHKELLKSGYVAIAAEHGSNVQKHVESIVIDRNEYEYSEVKSQSQSPSLQTEYRIAFHIYRANTRNAEVETFEADQNADGEEISASNHWLLPSHSFVGLWENLIYEEGLKEKLLQFAESSLVFSRHNVNQNVISCNRILLLHGPPGTGKTSLCKAIAQKMSIRLMATYKYTHLIEINSHSLFSRWFSESGKLVMKLFTKVREIVSQPNSLVCVLIDEVESIAYARDSMSGQEPKDAMRVVNALLTQLDSLKEFPNVLILTTSNLASNIDLAFLDRADIKQHIGLPSKRAIFQIYTSMLQELMRAGLTESDMSMPLECRKSMHSLVEHSVGVSGRTLRKLPFLAHATFIANITHPIDLDSFIHAMVKALEKHKTDQMLLQGSN